MGCGGSKSTTTTTPQTNTEPPQGSPTKSHDHEKEREDEIAVVEHQPIRTKSPMNAFETQAKLKIEEKKTKERFEARLPDEHLTEPEQPKIKTSLYFEQVGAAHFDLDGLEDKPAPHSSVKKYDTNERLQNDVAALLADPELGSKLD
mmetsp:Transcript_29273/g.52351  ORF Transcript_29273/g.52351 Transcript_29273/m.52351 type:complete len:147 (+) Transcript_29273:3098-3538(+)